jgi:hypothetical protein
VCGGCHAEVYRDYVEQDGIRRAVVGVVGFPGHGKTVFLTSLFYLLKGIQRVSVWPGYYWQPLDDNTHAVLHDKVPLFETGELPDATPVNFPRPSLIYFNKLPHYGRRFIILWDVSGEVYENTDMLTDHGRFVARSTVVLFIVSIPRLGDRWQDRMDALLDTYVQAVHSRMRADIKEDQNIVVVFTMADQVLDMLPGELAEYLQQGSYSWYLAKDAAGVKARMDEINGKSEMIKAWLAEKSCGAFLSKVRDSFKSFECAVVSATGASPMGSRLATMTMDDPKRVLDPFFWILERSKEGLREKLFGSKYDDD